MLRIQYKYTITTRNGGRRFYMYLIMLFTYIRRIPKILYKLCCQDNHYTDPIPRGTCSSRICRTKHRLNPDIAVLEGGYSIEGALPYINLGIILAMAGIDYSKVHEPDYDKDRLRQSKDITEYIKQISEIVYKRWKDKDDLGLKEFKGKDYVRKTRQIYYDTDGIFENQTQNYKVCKKCSGFNTIDSRSDKGYHVFAITIPRDACSNCVDEGYKLYKNTSTYYTNVYLQDRVNDKYYSK